MMNNFLIAGNWKMNQGPEEARDLLTGLNERIRTTEERVDIVVCPPYVTIPEARTILNESDVSIGAQNLHHEESGAFTGEISASMITQAGCRYVICGHSERRDQFGETDDQIAKKVQAAQAAGLIAILCVGEQLDQRKSNEHQAVVKRQLQTVLSNLKERDAARLVIAYEPVWAIGTGETATPAQAQEMHRFIRSILEEKFDHATAAGIRILYGGSMKPANAQELLEQPDVDGGLIGGASLDASSFTEIISIAQQIEK
ncbi:MAG: triose-phosphate isomerase [Bacteroidota bacterium]